MTRDEAVSRIQVMSGYRLQSATDVANALQDVQQRLEQEAELPWFLKSEIATETTTSGEERVVLPTGFLKEWEEDGLAYYDTTVETGQTPWKPLLKGELDTLRPKYPTSGPPEAYAFDGNYFRILPLPDDAYQLKLIFYKADTLLSTNVENKWLQYVPELLIGIAGQDMAPAWGATPARLTRFQQLEVDGRRRILQKSIDQDNVNREWLIGGED